MSWLELLKEAKIQPVGLALICKCPEGADAAKRQLYLARANARKAGDKTYDSLSISMSPHSDDILFIYQRTDEGEANDSPQSIGEGSQVSDN